MANLLKNKKITSILWEESFKMTYHNAITRQLADIIDCNACIF